MKNIYIVLRLLRLRRRSAETRSVCVLSYVLVRTSFASRCVAMPSDSPGDAESFGTGELKTCSEEDRWSGSKTVTSVIKEKMRAGDRHQKMKEGNRDEGVLAYFV